MARAGVSFELERFGWTGGGSVLEVAGRWRGPRPRRLGPATLAVEAGGRRRLTPSVVSGDPRVDPEPTLWRAEFPWTGDAAGRFELEVGSNLVIDLPAPEGAPPEAGAAAVAASRAAAGGALEAAQRQIEADRAEIERLRGELVVLRREAAEVQRTKELLKQAQAIADTERTAVRAKREEAAARRAAALDAGERSPAEVARQEAAELELELERVREAAATSIREADLAGAELVKARSIVGAAVEESLERERSFQSERDAALKEARRLQDLLTAAEARAVAPPEPPPEPSPEPAEADILALPGDAAPPAEAEAPAQALEDEPTDTLVLESPRRRTPVHQYRARVTVLPQRTPSAPRRYAERPPKDSPALRAIAGVLLLLLIVVLVAVLVIVT